MLHRLPSYAVRPLAGAGAPFTVDTTGRDQGVHNLSRSVTFNGAVAEVANSTTWDINPGAGSMQISSTTNYNGWQGAGASLDTRYGFANFDTFTVNAGNSGFANGAAVKVNLAVTVQVSAQTDAFRAQTGSNFLDFAIYLRDPASGFLNITYGDKIFSLDYDVTVYDFYRKAVVQGVTQFDLTTDYVNGQGNEADLYQFDLELDAVVGETLELGMMLGRLSSNVYNYELVNLAHGTRQDLASGQEQFGNEFATTFSWDIEHVDGFDGLDVVAFSGFVPSASAASPVPEPATATALLGLLALSAGLTRRRPRA